MNNKRDSHDTRQGSRSADVIGELIRHAGVRPTAPDAMRRQVEAAARQAWLETAERTKTRHRRQRRGVVAAFGIAATIAVAIVSTVLLRPAAAPTSRPIAGFDRISGDTSQLRVNDQLATLSTTLAPGDIIETGDGVRVGLRPTGATATSLRLDSNTRLVLDGPQHLSLQYGRVYADTGPKADQKKALTITTLLGQATDIGTQFAVGYQSGRMTVGVREGLVKVATEYSSYETQANRLSIVLPGGQVTKSDLAASDPAWSWVYEVAPKFDADQPKVIDYLRWVERETGRHLQFADGALELAVDTDFGLSGRVDKLPPNHKRGWAMALQDASLKHELRGDTIIVSVIER